MGNPSGNTFTLVCDHVIGFPASQGYVIGSSDPNG